MDTSKVNKPVSCFSCIHYVSAEGYKDSDKTCWKCLDHLRLNNEAFLYWEGTKNIMSKSYDEAFRTEGTILDRRAGSLKAQREAKYKMVEEGINKADVVNHPPHYLQGKIEPITVIEDWKLNYNLGNALKYISRCNHKGNKKQDINKAIWYLKRELEHGCN